MDTDTIVAAMRSPSGGSAALLRAARAGRATLLATAPLCIEYESVCSRIEHVEAAGFSEADLYRPAQVLTRLPRLPRAGRAASAPDQDLCGLVLTVFLDAVVALVEPVEAWFLWRPQLRDPGDELVLEAAVNGRAAAIATFNRRDFQAGAARFGVDVLLPGDALRRLMT